MDAVQQVVREVTKKNTFDDPTRTSFVTLWIVFVIMALSGLVFLAQIFSSKHPDTLSSPKKRHYFTFMIVITAALSYFAMATDSGYSLVQVKPGSPSRTVFWARYLDWSITTPLLLLDVTSLVQAPFFVVTRMVYADIAMIVTGVIAALSGVAYKWAWYTFSCLFFAFIIYDLMVTCKNSSKQNAAMNSKYTKLAGYLIILWIAYPIVWALAEGQELISVNAEVVCYAILDVLAKVVFGFMVVYADQAEETYESLADGPNENA